MLNRLSTQALNRQGLNTILNNQTELAKIQNQMGTGNKVNVAADDPVAMSKIMGVERAQADVARWQRNAGSLSDRLTLEDSTLGSVNDALDRIRVLALQGGTATVSDTDRQAISSEMSQLLGDIVSLANTKDSQGRYIFAGSKDGSPPFIPTDQGVKYTGDSSVLMLDVGPTREIAAGDSGDDVFMRLKTGDGRLTATAGSTNTGAGIVTGLSTQDSAQWDGGTYRVRFTDTGGYEVLDDTDAVIGSGAFQPGQAIAFRGVALTVDGAPAGGDEFTVSPSTGRDLFTTVDDLVQLISARDLSTADQARRQTRIFEALQALDTGQTHLAEVRGMTGARMAGADDANQQLIDRQLQLDATLSGLQDLDYADAAVQLSQRQLALQAAQQSYTKIQGLSLFNYL